MSLYHRIIVPLDDSPCAQRGLRAAIDLAIDQRAQLKLITVVGAVTADYAGGELGWVETGNLDTQLRDNATQQLEQALTLAKSTGLSPEHEMIEAHQGHVAEVIEQAAAEWAADLLVIGTHGRHGLERWLFGSMTEHLIRRPRLPILVIPANDTDNAKT